MLPAEKLFVDTENSERLDHYIRAYKTNILQDDVERNASFFGGEMNKLDNWAEDVKNSLETELKNLERNIKYRKTESRKIANLKDKVAEQLKIKDAENRRNELRRNLYQAQDEVDRRKEKLIDDVEKRMKQQLNLTELFTIRWSLV